MNSHFQTARALLVLALLSAAVYLSFALLLVPSLRERWRGPVVLAALLLVFLIGFSRLYLGVHYPSDVLGGFSAGLAWLSVCGATRRFIAQRLAGRSAI